MNRIRKSVSFLFAKQLAKISVFVYHIFCVYMNIG